MLKFLRKNWYHFVIWALMIGYVFAAPGLYNRIFLQHGKPVATNISLPAESNLVKYNIELFDPTAYKSETYYTIVGWSFDTSDPGIPTDNYERQIILISDKNNYVFPTSSYWRPDVQTFYKSLNMQLTNSGYHCEISPLLIRSGEYRIGLLFKNPKTGEVIYSLTNRFLIRTPNTIELIKKDAS